MSFIRRHKLRSFVITTVDSSGKTEKKTLKRGHKEQLLTESDIKPKFQKMDEAEPTDQTDNEESPDWQDMNEHETISLEQLPSLHSIRQKANVAAWLSTRSFLINVCSEMNSLRADQLCSLCDTNKAMFRCIQCGPLTYFCSLCLHSYHLKTSVLHSPEEFKVTEPMQLCHIESYTAFFVYYVIYRMAFIIQYIVKGL